MQRSLNREGRRAWTNCLTGRLPRPRSDSIRSLGSLTNVFGTRGNAMDGVQQGKHGGALLALASAFLFGASTPIAKLLLGVTDPLSLAGLLYLGSGAGLPLRPVRGRSLGLGRSEAPLRAGDLPWLGAIVLFGGILGPALLMWGLTRTSASTGALLLNTEGLATMAIAWVVFRENVDRRIFLGAMAILAGAVVLSWPEAAATGPRLSWGSVLIVLACVSWGIDNNLTRKLSSADPGLRHL